MESTLHQSRGGPNVLCMDACLLGKSGRNNRQPNATLHEIDDYRETIDQALGTILAAGNILFPDKSRRLVTRPIWDLHPVTILQRCFLSQ